jgi:hypothetical protein
MASLRFTPSVQVAGGELREDLIEGSLTVFAVPWRPFWTLGGSETGERADEVSEDPTGSALNITSAICAAWRIPVVILGLLERFCSTMESAEGGGTWIEEAEEAARPGSLLPCWTTCDDVNRGETAGEDCMLDAQDRAEDKDGWELRVVPGRAGAVTLTGVLPGVAEMGGPSETRSCRRQLLCWPRDRSRLALEGDLC